MISKLVINNVPVALIESEQPVIVDTSSALDTLIRARYDCDADRLVVGKSALCEDFFVLSTGVAGDILQKFVNYGVKLAVFGDFSVYTSKPLKDFIGESNRGTNVFFAKTKEEALEMITQAR